MFRVFKISVLLLLAGFSVQAQNVFTPNSSGGGFNFTVGYQGFSSNKWFENYYSKDKSDTFNVGFAGRIDQSANLVTFSKAIYEKPKSGMYSFGFQGYGAFSSVIIGGEINARLSGIQGGKQIDSVVAKGGGGGLLISSTTSRFYNASATVDLGYIAYRKRGFVLYPMVGLGYSATGLRLRSQSTSRAYPEIATVVTASDPNLQNIFVWTTGLGLDFGIGAQYFLGSSNEDRAKGFSLGLRAGYSMQPATNDIRINGKKAVDGKDMNTVELPKLGAGGVYVKLLIGYGRLGE